MQTPLSQEQTRVLGALIEKQLTTPEYYPLTLNALLAACNQKSNRQPVVAYDADTIQRALEALRGHGLAREIHDPAGRVPRFGHRANAVLGLDAPQVAVLCELLLRGPQTVSELRSRASRLHNFNSAAQVEEALAELAGREEGPLVRRLERRPGTREERWAHLLAGEPAAESSVAPSPAQPTRTELEARVTRLEEEVARLRAELDELIGGQASS